MGWGWEGAGWLHPAPSLFLLGGLYDSVCPCELSGWGNSRNPTGGVETEQGCLCGLTPGG